MKKIELRKSAVKDLNGLDNTVKKQIIKALQDLEKFPEIPNCKRLVNFEPAYRYRNGDYRILFDVFEDIVYVARILHRKEAYRIK